MCYYCVLACSALTANWEALHLLCSDLSDVTCNFRHSPVLILDSLSVVKLPCPVKWETVRHYYYGTLSFFRNEKTWQKNTFLRSLVQVGALQDSNFYTVPKNYIITELYILWDIFSYTITIFFFFFKYCFVLPTLLHKWYFSLHCVSTKM